ncbi:MAG: DUF1146 domain-containing protein [Erysipelotrichaceae bacterium]|nr:DUF1146 domain-containing protein [Erysipelotrichaceae bacterium]MBP5280841.1 DUF1146 domain-containing protein [Erysipelotrichaceae bacterium]
MLDFYIRVIIYFICFFLSFYGLSALDFNRFLKQGKVVQGQILYFILASSLAYLMGNFFIAIIYFYNK